MLIKELQSYFDRNNGNSKVENTMSLANHFSQFIELNSYFENGTIERVNEASKSATEIFQRLFKNEDSADLAKVLVALLRDDEKRKRLSENGRLSAQKYDWQVVAEQIENVYEMAIAGGERVTLASENRFWSRR